jgi:dephospho-CoA kinase
MIIGLTGHAGTGKDEVGKILIQKYGAVVLSTSQPLRAILEDCHLEITRKHLQDLGAAVYQHLGPSIITEALLRTALPNQLIVLNAVRFVEELRHLVTRDDFRLLAIQSHFALRLERLRNRDRDDGEAMLSIEDLRQQDTQKSEIEIPFLITSATELIRNDSSIHDLEIAVESAMDRFSGLRRTHV